MSGKTPFVYVEDIDILEGVKPLVEYKTLVHIKRKCKMRRETEFFRQNSVSLH